MDMQVTFIGHASVLVETGGITILSDPWWSGPCFGAQWWIYPPPRTDLVDIDNIDYVYISHGHHDHYHPGTLKTFSRKTRVLVSHELDLAPSIRKLGLETLTLRPDEAFQLADHTRCWIWPTHGHDTLMVIDDGQEVCVNINDALHAAPRHTQDAFIKKLTGMFPRIDYVFCGYGVASHFPNCYEVPGLDRIRTAQKRQHFFNRSWARIIHDLEPKYGFPFAANVVFYEEDLFFVNEPTHNHERPTDWFLEAYKNSPTQVMDIAPGFTMRDGEVANQVLRQPVSGTKLRSEHANDVVRANRCARVTEQAVTQLANVLQKNIDVCSDYLLEYDGDYQFVIRLRNSNSGFLIEKQGASITMSTVHSNIDAWQAYDVLYKTRLSYLRRSLTQQYGSEVLFVGSGGIFVYRTARDARRNLHRELRTMMTLHQTCPPSRFGGSAKWVYQQKQFAKRLLRVQPTGLYDLQDWLVFSGH
jgi:hypothetical protein